ncbi:MAG TPA: TIGR01906 family membrane protein [Firmicutes bacterium]|jgi:integral membrane protein (TIGR01906 family)|nr:TIGR01906 family membrane protein [Bacillota bacterium]HAA37883.1 TIGR01906 family membrane protein [Bacillota bacterium]
MKKLLLLLLAVLLPLVVLLTTIQLIVNNDGFFAQQYIINEVPAATQIELSELLRITDEIQAYLFGRRPDFLIEGVVNGVQRQVFNAREIAHMKDVQLLFAKGVRLRNLSAVIVILLLLWLWLKDRAAFYRALWVSAVVFFAAAVLGSLLLYLDFNRYFVLFHEIFFDNDLWILDPQTSILIRMVPLNFFMQTVKQLGILTALQMLLLGILGYGGQALAGRRKAGS